MCGRYDGNYMLHLEAGDKKCGRWVICVCQLTVVSTQTDGEDPSISYLLAAGEQKRKTPGCASAVTQLNDILVSLLQMCVRHANQN